MRRYQCHKVVEAARVISVVGNAVRLEHMKDLDTLIVVPVPWLARFAPVSDHDLGYYVRYEDGSESWSSTQAFEDGYTLLA